MINCWFIDILFKEIKKHINSNLFAVVQYPYTVRVTVNSNLKVVLICDQS